MKKIFLIILILTLLLWMAGCTKTAVVNNGAQRSDINTSKDVTQNVNENPKENIVNNKPDVAKGGKGSITALTRAAGGGHIKIAKQLIERGADIEMALDGCLQLKSARQTRCLKVLGMLKTERDNRSQPVRQYVRPAPVVSDALSIVKSDVDILPILKVKPATNSCAIVIGIEQYRQKLPRADFAVQDAKKVTEYLTKVMGYPEEKVVTLLNDRATNVDLAKYFEKWLPNNVEKGSSVFIYFSGHGAPDPKTGGSYLVPYDGDPTFITETGYSLKRMYNALEKLPAKEIVVALDSCFSGAGGRSVLAEGARPLVMSSQKTPVLPGNTIVLAAASNEQISSTYKEKGHGLFTYFLLKGIKNENVIRQDGSLAVSDLFTYVKPQVELIARKQYNNEQTPQLIQAKQQSR